MSFIPIDPGNSDYRQINERIAAGQLAAKPQAFTWACPTFSANGTQTGYDTNLGFIPQSEENSLFSRLLTAVEEGTCDVRSAPQSTVDPMDYVEHLVVCVFLDQAWPHITGSYQGSLSLKPNENVPPKHFTFCLRNVGDSEGKGALPLLLAEHGCSFDVLPTLNRPIQAGVLEIEIPVGDLRKILRGELADANSPQSSFQCDIVDQALVRSGRKKEDGPPVDWLVGYAHLYLQSFVSDFSNRIVEAFWHEYGGVPIGHISPFSLQRRFLVLHRKRSGTIAVGTFSSVEPGAFALQGQWRHPVGLEFVSDSSQPANHSLRRALSRLRMLTEAGFHMEAVVLANSVLEVSVTSALTASVFDRAELQADVAKLGHGMRLTLLEELAVVNAVDDKHVDERKAIVSDMRQIYRHRNDYVHELTMPGEVPFLDFRSQRSVHNLVRRFSDPFEQQRWFWWMDTLAAGGSELVGVVSAFLVSKLQPEQSVEEGEGQYPLP
ncbi:hypothetical protein G8D25_23625 [Ralstonia solanacearum]|uniref:hypothetical protein n=1 Tax=Ralstonia solanacearum TaxID=305 RepID=UPI001448A994|nr:hypothetical protein [Ralstonia solanacearum]QJC26865.1 hypothetical protein G8D25_23625 [Ralstonia solanacearum]